MGSSVDLLFLVAFAITAFGLALAVRVQQIRPACRECSCCSLRSFLSGALFPQQAAEDQSKH